MKPDRQHLARMMRIERIRAIASRTAASQAAAAEGTLAQLLALRDRTREIQAGHDPRLATDVVGLGQMARFQSGMSRIAAQTEVDIATARRTADSRQDDRRRAEQRRVIAQDRADAVCKSLAREGNSQPAPGRKPIWHDT